MNVSLSGDEASAEVNQSKMGSAGLGRAPQAGLVVSVQVGNLNTHRGKKAEAETGAMCLRAKDTDSLQSHQELGKGKEGSPCPAPHPQDPS